MINERVKKDQGNLISDEFSPPMVFDFPPLKKGEYIEKYFMDYIKMNNITLKRKYINVAWATLYYDQQFKRIHLTHLNFNMSLISYQKIDILQ